MKTRQIDRLIVGFGLLLAGTLYGCGGSGILDSSGGERVTETRRETFSVDASAATRLSANTTNGTIELRAGTGSMIEVTAVSEVKAHDQNLAESLLREIRVRVERQGDEVVVEADAPRKPDRVDVNVNYEITAPAHLVSHLVSVNSVISVADMEGGVVATGTNSVIEIRGTCGPVEAGLVNGVITADVKTVSGPATFAVVNGNINVTIREGVQPVSATTLNGSVTVALPATFSGNVDVQTLNGTAVSDFAVTDTVTRRNNRIVGQIGEGGSATATLKATNGDVRLRRAG